MAITLDMSDWDDLVKNLEAFASKTARKASSIALSETASAARDAAKVQVGSQMTLRNHWTAGSIQSSRTPKSRPIEMQFTLAGSRQGYMADQESGGLLSRTKHGRRMTTAKGSGEGTVAYPRKRTARGRKRPRAIRIAPDRKYKGQRSKRTKAFLDVLLARKDGFDFVWLELPKNRQGIFDVRAKTKIWMVHAVSKRQLRVGARPWLEPAVDQVMKSNSLIWTRAIETAVAQDGLFR
jgi:hypothetical protein